LGCKKQLRKTILRLFSEVLILSTSFVGNGQHLLEDQVVFWVASDSLGSLFVQQPQAGFSSKLL
jgi:hypothetical protein